MNLPKGYLTRISTSDQGTKGVLVIPGFSFSCCVIELPWRNNIQKYSCIPLGDYLCRIRRSPRFGKVYWVMEVEGRSWVLTHWGNLAGDVLKGWKTHSEGCLILGKYFGKLKGQDAVLYSRPIFRDLMSKCGDLDMLLHIKSQTFAAEVM